MTNKNAAAPGTIHAADVCRQFQASDSARDALDDKSQPIPFLRMLIAKELHPDAVQMIAHYLPKRQAVWWACQCAKGSMGPKSTPEMKAAIEAAEKWVSQPTEENRRSAMQAAEAEESGSAANLVALAAAFAEQPSVPDPKAQIKQQFMTAKLAAGAVLLAAVSDAEKAKKNLAEFVAQGLTVVNRTYPQKEA